MTIYHEQQSKEKVQGTFWDVCSTYNVNIQNNEFWISKIEMTP